MANKYNVRRQLQAEKANREIQSISSKAQFAQNLIGFGEEIYNAIDEIHKKKDTVDASNVLTQIQSDYYQTCEDLSYEQIKSIDPVTGEETYTRGNKLSAYETEQAIRAHYGDNFLKDNGYITDDSSTTFTDALTQGFTSWRNEQQVYRASQLVLNSQAELQSSVDSKVNYVIENAGTEGKSSEFLTSLKQLTTSTGASLYYGLDSGTYDENGNLLATSTSTNQEESAVTKARSDFSVAKEYIFQLYRQAYTKEEASIKTEEKIKDLALSFESNSALSQLPQLLKTDANINIGDWAVRTASNLDTSPYRALLGNNQFSQDDIVSFINKLETYGNYVVSNFSNQITSALAQSFNDLYTLYSEGTYESGHFLDSQSVDEALNNVASQLGTTVDIMTQYMSTDTLQIVSNYQTLALYNDYYAEAYEMLNIINGTDEQLEAYAKEHNISYNSIDELKYMIKNTMSLGAQNLLYDSDYDDKVFFQITTGRPTVSSSSGTSNSSGYLTPLGESIGAQDWASLQADDEFQANWKYYTEGQQALINDYQTLNFLDQIGTISGDADFASFLSYIYYTPEEGSEEKAPEITDPELQKMKEAFQPYYNQIMSVLANYGIKSLNGLTPALIEKIKSDLNTDMDVLASDLADSSSTIEKSGRVTGFNSKNADTIKKQARLQSSKLKAIKGEDGKITYDNTGTGYDSINFDNLYDSWSVYTKEQEIESGEIWLEYAERGLSYLDTYDKVLDAIEDPETSFSLSGYMYNLQTIAPDFELLVKQVLGLKGEDKIDWTKYDSPEALAGLKTQIEHFIETKSTSMAGLSSKIGEIKKKRGVDYTTTDAEGFVKKAQASPSVVDTKTTFETNYNNWTDAVNEVKEANRLANHISVETYYYTGEEDENFQAKRAYLEASKGRKVTSEEVYQYIKSTETNFDSYTSPNLDDAIADAKQIAYNQDCALYMAVATYDSSNPSATNQISLASWQSLYKTFVGDDVEGKAADELARAIVKSEKFKSQYVLMYGSEVKGFNANFKAVTAEGTEATQENADVKTYPITINEFLVQKWQEQADGYYNELVEVELPRLEEKHGPVYTRAVEDVENKIKLEEEAQQTILTNVDSALTDEAYAQLMAGSSDEVAVSNLIAIAKTVNINLTQEEAQTYLAKAKGVSRNDKGIFQVSFSTFDLGPTENVTEWENRCNIAIDNEVKGIESDFAKQHFSKNLAMAYANVMYLESKKEKPDYETALTNFENSLKNNTNNALSAFYNINDKGKVESAKGYGRFSTLDELDFGYYVANGEASHLAIISMLNSSEDQKDWEKTFLTFSTDTSIKDSKKEKYKWATAIQLVMGDNFIDMSQLDSMSISDLRSIANEQTAVKEYIYAIASTLDEADDIVSDFVKYASTNEYFNVSGKDTNGNTPEVHLIINESGICIQSTFNNGKVVYAKPVYNSTTKEITEFKLYSDESCTSSVFSASQSSRQGVTEEQIQQINLTSTLNEKNKDAEPLTKEVFNTIFNGTAEEKEALGDKKFYYLDNHGNLTSGDQTVIRDATYKGSNITLPLPTYEADMAVKKLLYLDGMYESGLQTSTLEPNQLTSLHIADKTYKVEKAGVVTSLTKVGNDMVAEYEGKTFKKNGKKFEPILDGQLTYDQEKEYTIYAEAIVKNSNNAVSFEDAFNAVALAYTGYDKVFTYMDEKGQISVYVPELYRIIRNGWWF